ncbi:MAG: hypothetical protein K2Y71_01970 [Xanthobacteraceae bacterium]|nr:hypothetical protein [Xanthobacteraceae bacterium]
MKLWPIILAGVLLVSAPLAAHAQSAPPPQSAPPAQRPVPASPMPYGKAPAIGGARAPAPGAAPPVAPSSELVSPSERRSGTPGDSSRSSDEQDPPRPGAR